MTNKQVLITTVPFGEADPKPLESLAEAGIGYTLNPFHRKLREQELSELIGDCTVLIAGTEPITERVMDRAPNLRLISRVGIGLDNVDLLAARQRGIQVCYTPDAPSAAVAELTVGLMLSLLRSIPNADRSLRRGVWHRYMGRRLAECTVGVIGVGRVGHKLIRCLSGFRPTILANDIQPDFEAQDLKHVRWTNKDSIYAHADIITVHVPLTGLTWNLISKQEIDLMKPTALLINTSRGGVVNEEDLASALESKRISGAALDVFEEEPYSGRLAALENCVLTCHMGSMTLDCRARMELEAAEEAIRYLTGQPMMRCVPEEEFVNPAGRSRS